MRPVTSKLQHEEDTSRLFPLFANLRRRRVLVVGGGTVALRKLQALLGCGARVRVGARSVHPQLLAMAEQGLIELELGSYQSSWLDARPVQREYHAEEQPSETVANEASELIWLVVAATEQRAVNESIASDCEARRIFCNVVDDAELSSVQMPARVERGALQIAISSGGSAPMLARAIREKLEAELDPSLTELSRWLERKRQHIVTAFSDLAERRRFFDRLLNSPLPDLLRRGDHAAAERSFDQLLDASDVSRSGERRSQRGRVALVGAGPGDPGLLSLRGLRLLNQADVILHDRLVSRDILELARRDATFIEVGKQAQRHHVPQDAIHALMREHAEAGRTVVRLKGGDPFIFGRGGEELEYLRAHGIDYEVVPGVTAALACAAYSGIPLTHRDHAQSVRFVTAHCRDSLDTLEWRALAQERQTLAVYMGVSGLQTLQTRLVEHGRSADTPCALIEQGSRRTQRVLVAPLAEIAEHAEAHCVASPALLIVGEVTALAQRLHWFGAPPIVHLGNQGGPSSTVPVTSTPSEAVGAS